MPKTKTPSKKELFTALILCTLLFGLAVAANTLKANRSESYVGGLEAGSRSQYELISQFGLSGPSTQTSEGQIGRLRDIRQWIKGELEKGTFETVVSSIEDETQNLGGYVDSEDVTYSEDLWNGELVSKIPQNNSLELVFKVRNLISANGKVVSITTNIKDITPQTETATNTKPLATIRVTLKETSDQPSQFLPRIEFPYIAAIAPFLGTFFTLIATGIVIGLPAYFTVLGIILLVKRALIPIANKLIKKT